MKNFKKLFVAASSVAALSCANSYAAGYSSNVYSTSGLANSYAGSVTGTHDVSDLHFNPATSVNLGKSQMILSGSYANYDIGGKGSDFNSSNGDEDLFIPAFYSSILINEDLALGLAVNNPYNLQTSYDRTWRGRYFTKDSSISAININPSIAYKLTDSLSVGAGFQAQYLKTTFTQIVQTGSESFAKSHGSDWGHGYNLGLQYQANDKIKLGIAYRSKIDHKITGTVNMIDQSLFSDFDLKMTTPESATVGISYQATDKLQLAYDATWTRWSRMKIFDLNAGNANLNSTVPTQMKDSMMHSLGLNYQATGDLLLRTGVAYEKEAVTDQARTARFPLTNKIWTSLGLNYKITNSFSVDLAYMHQFFRQDTVNHNDGFPVNYQNKTSLDVYSLAVKKEF